MAIKIAGTDVISDDKRFINNESLPSIRPSLLLDFANSKTLDPRIDFTRSSTATYYDGKTHAKAEENLLKSSQAIGDSNWTVKTGITIHLDNAAAPDGTTTATKLTPTTASANHYLGQLVKTTNGNSYSVSFYAKANGYDNVGSTDHYYGEYQIIFSLTGSGVLDKTANVSNASVTSVGNSWYRCQFTYSTTRADVTFTIYPTAASAISGTSHYNYTGDGTSGCYVWGAQFEHRDSVTAYTPTTSQPITNYIPVLQTAASGTARFDHDPVTGESKGLLIEEQRTNLFNYSHQFGGWSISNASITSNQAIAPDGTLSADLLTEDTSYQQHLTFLSPAVSVQDYTISAYFKEPSFNSKRYVSLTMHGMGYVAFDIQDGAVEIAYGSGTNGYGIEDAGNGWYRCWASFAKDNTNTGAYIILHNGTSGGHLYTGDGVSGMLVWGAQLEAGSFPTSYIPTSGSQVTRSVDKAYMTGSDNIDWFRQDEGTMYGEVAYPVSNFGSNKYLFTASNDAAVNFISLRNRNGGTHGFVVESSGNEANLIGESATANTFEKLAGAYKFNDSGAATVGNDEGTDTSCIIPNGLTHIGIGRLQVSGGDSFSITGHIRKLAYYPTRLTNAELTALTED